jgi:carbon monoxide dehydrogenase subunit G
MEIRHEIEVRRPPELVFDFLTDTASFPVLDRAVVSWTPDGAMRVGLHGTFVHRRGFATARTTWTVEELERPSRVRVAIQGSGYEMEETATLAMGEGGTRVTFVDTVRPTSIAGRVMVALSGAIMRRDLRARSALLKSTLEEGEGGDTRAGTTMSASDGRGRSG